MAAPLSSEVPTKLLPHEVPSSPVVTQCQSSGIATSVAVAIPNIPHYRIVESLGGGGMGQVFKAINRLGIAVALKVIRSDRQDSSFVTRFLEEAAALMRLNHPNIVRILGFEEYDGTPFLVTELLTGGTLAEHAKEYQSNPRKTLELLLPIAEATAYLHSTDKIHRDIKPQNILLDSKGKPYLSDFGLVKALDQEVETLLPVQPGTGSQSTIQSLHNHETGVPTPKHVGSEPSTATKAGVKLGTRPYMSPEQIRPDLSKIGPKCDVWGLAVVAFELLAGRRPFEAADDRLLEQRIVEASPDWNQLPRFENDEPVRKCLQQCFSVDPDLRPSAKEMVEVLKTWLATPNQPIRLSRRWILVGLTVLGIMVAALAVAFLVPRQKSQATTTEQPVVTLEQELRTHGKVNLLDDDGRPRWSTWQTGEMSKHYREGVCTFRFDEENLVPMLEFAHLLNVEKYRLSLKIRHDEKWGQIGVYVGRSTQPTEIGPHHCYVCGIVRDHARPEGSLLSGEMHACATKNPTGIVQRLLSEYIQPTPAGGWHRVVVEHTLERIMISVDNCVVLDVARNALLQSASKFSLARDEFRAVAPTFHPSDGVGVFAKRTSVSIRDVTLEVLK